MKKSTLLRGITSVAVCALALASLTGASGARAATLTVLNLNDSGPGSLRQAIADANPGDTITFGTSRHDEGRHCGLTGTITLTSGALTINKDLDIEGPGPCRPDRDEGKGRDGRDSDGLTISGNHASRVFVVGSGTVTIAGVTIRDGLADLNSPILASTGGGILNLASLILSDDVVSDNQALGDKSQAPFTWSGSALGGGVCNAGILAVTDCSFTGNLVRGGDGSSGDIAPGIASGGAISNFGNADVTRSQFTGNVSQAASGNGSSGSAYAGKGYAGAIGSVGSLSITACTFSHNQAIGGNHNSGLMSGNANGGAVYTEEWSSSSWLEVRDSRFDDNQAIGGNGNLNPASLGGMVWGGAVQFNGPGTISGCTLDHNDALGGAGAPGAMGGYGMGGGLNVEGQNVTVNNCTVEDNTAVGGPGGLGGNGAGGAGGGLRSGGGATLTVINTTVAHNHAQGGKGLAGGKGGDAQGGGLQTFMGSLVLEGAIVTDNLALGGCPGGQGIGGGVYNGGAFSFDATTVIAKNHASTSNDNVGP